MRFGDRETGVRFFKRDRRGSVDRFGRQAGFPEFGRERHRETTGVCSRDEFFGIGPDAVFKTRAERVLRVFQDAAVR